MSDIVLRYLGGAFIHGVPARDLTAAEAAQYGAHCRAGSDYAHAYV